MHRIDPYQNFSVDNAALYSLHILHRMMGFHGVQPFLAGILADILHIHEDAIHTGGFCNLRNLRTVGNIHEFQHKQLPKSSLRRLCSRFLGPRSRPCFRCRRW